jgi:hypothetical protein
MVFNATFNNILVISWWSVLLVDETNLYLPSNIFPLKYTFCSNRNLSICSFEEKFISLETVLHFNIFFGTRAEMKKKISQFFSDLFF